MRASIPALFHARRVGHLAHAPRGTRDASELALEFDNRSMIHAYAVGQLSACRVATLRKKGARINLGVALDRKDSRRRISKFFRESISAR